VRDAGLVALGMRSLGIDAQFVARGEGTGPKDRPLILATLAQMGDAAWWRQWKLEGVALYAWGVPRYTPIARAIKTAGCKLALVLDNDGVVSPRVWASRYLVRQYYVEAEERPRLLAAILAAAKTALAAIPARHAGRVQHLELADAMVLPSPLAKERFCRFLESQGRTDLIKKVHFAPYAVVPEMTWQPGMKRERAIIAVGRWQTVVKNAPLLVAALARALKARPAWRARVLGNGGDIVKRLIAATPGADALAIEVPGAVPHDRLPDFYRKSAIMLTTSFYESFHIASAEALCCGCSVVGDARIPSMPYMAGSVSGTVYSIPTTGNVADALLTEMDSWDSGDRNPDHIGAWWTARLHPDRVAERILSTVREY